MIYDITAFLWGLWGFSKLRFLYDMIDMIDMSMIFMLANESNRFFPFFQRSISLGLKYSVGKGKGKAGWGIMHACEGWKWNVDLLQAW